MSDRVLHPAQFFHGTATGIKGGVVRPHDPAERITGRSNPANSAAYSSSNYNVAADWAGMRTYREGKLFGSIYEVSPRSVQTTPEKLAVNPNIADPEGLDVVRHVGFVDDRGRSL